MLVFVVFPLDVNIKLKECEKLDNYQDLGIKLEKLWNKEMTVGPIVVRAMKITPTDIVKTGRIETLWKNRDNLVNETSGGKKNAEVSARILRRFNVISCCKPSIFLKLMITQYKAQEQIKVEACGMGVT